MQAFKYVIIGGGVVAGYAAKEFARRDVQPGELCIVSNDNALPYDRPSLSKKFLLGKKDEAGILINDEAFYRDKGITVKLETPVAALDATRKRITTESGEEIGYDKLLIATGSYLRRFDLPGSHLNGLYYLRRLVDSKAIRAAAHQARRAVVIGAGFIGMEVASALRQYDVETTMVFPEDRVWQKFFTPEASSFFQQYYEQRGVTLLPGNTIREFAGEGHVSEVVLGSGQRLPVDMVVAGIGVRPATDIFENSGLDIDRGIVVNEYLETNIPDIWAAGDVTNYRDVIFDKQRHIEHWDNAVQQAKRAVRNMMGSRRPLVYVPYFFSDVFDLSYEFWGDTSGADEIIHRGDIEQAAFSIWWLRGGQLVAAWVMGRPKEEAELAPKWIEAHQHVPADVLRDANKPLSSLA
jgi:NADPH-dependent 2,4-dienoyl-CoA reductase/sulfur reductase-like enzyme